MTARLMNGLAILAAVLFLFSQTIVQGQQASTGGPKMFGSAQEAADALVAAAETFNETALKEILGANSYDLIYTGEPVRDRETVMEFGKMGREKITLTPAPKNKTIVLLGVGANNWPSPLPIVKKTGGWVFDVEAGRRELLYRRVGRNELDAIKICRGYVEAQHEYALTKHDGAPVNQYAQRIISTPGKQDGLAWRNADGSPGGPVGQNVAKAIEQGYTDKLTPFRGYIFKVLKGQGPAAPLGEMSFVIDGYMIGGFALVAYPAQYGVTGVKTFIVANDGVVYEKDLGMRTVDLAKEMEVFNPDKTWSPLLEDK